MTDKSSGPSALSPTDVLAPHDTAGPSTPIWLVSESQPVARLTGLDDTAKAWLERTRFTSAAKKQALIPGPQGALAGVALGIGNGSAGDPSGPSDLLMGQLAASLPEGLYHLGGDVPNAELAAIAWGLGAYRFRRYKSAPGEAPPRLKLPQKLDYQAVVNQVGAIWKGRDLINTPASDLAPEDLEAAAQRLARDHGASIETIVGDDLLEKGFRMIHAVGRASSRAPRLIDVRWQKPGGNPKAPMLTLVGKGITFDTGGLDIKPASGMLLMKKDMGGAAAALTLAELIMSRGLDVRLRLLIAAAENSISGDAFRPGDILLSRAGKTVEIGNTDAEGRLVLADALSLADEEQPDTILVFATLTGAARVALGPDLPAFFTNDNAFAEALSAEAEAVGDPVWRLPFWPGYERHLDSDIADMNNVYDAPFAGAITAALFLKRFVKNARRFAHFDLYGWRPAPRPLGPKGGEPQTARALFSLLTKELCS
ncbi:leucyl aminopeptidase family protein [Hyphomicrobium zavarzinii]|jgi:leucyl aminopeptidase|uniref:leucyl aminopeptidase family protein n=1 Tax=Hyphomicrobium zavarzinii TaxID=48292 RepID=UPI0003708F33|nr:leucyl aminopeptidase family protein [Hyphomicrobium zavarzinii]HML43415.1 leucyl aminopeptidase family protein [Hyphomicrobium zavarzinii]